LRHRIKACMVTCLDISKLGTGRRLHFITREDEKDTLREPSTMISETTCQIYGATMDKKEDDALKTKRAIRDSWVLQMRQVCETSKPTTPLMVFGSTSHQSNTRFYVMDIVGCIRVSSIATMVIPVDGGDFADRMRACMTTCLKFALAISTEIENRKKATFITKEDEKETLRELSHMIPETSVSPIKYSKA